MAGVAVALIMACDDGHEEDDTQFRKDVIWCEEAVAHLEECCEASTFNPNQIECRHYYEKDTGCGQTSITRVDPAYTENESDCIRAQSCASLRANKVCERALAAGKARTERYESIDIGSSSTTTTSGSVSSSSGGTSSTSTTSGSTTSGPICP